MSEERESRFKVACRILRNAGHLDRRLPGQRRGESPIDWLVRLGLAPTAEVAAEMLILGWGQHEMLDYITNSRFNYAAAAKLVPETVSQTIY